MLALFFTSLTDLHTLPKSAKRADDSRSTHQWETDKGQQSLPRSLSVVQMPIDYSEVKKKKKKIADSANRRRQSTRLTVTQANTGALMAMMMDQCTQTSHIKHRANIEYCRVQGGSEEGERRLLDRLISPVHAAHAWLLSPLSRVRLPGEEHHKYEHLLAESVFGRVPVQTCNHQVHQLQQHFTLHGLLFFSG